MCSPLSQGTSLVCLETKGLLYLSVISCFFPKNPHVLFTCSPRLSLRCDGWHNSHHRLPGCAKNCLQLQRTRLLNHFLAGFLHERYVSKIYSLSSHGQVGGCTALYWFTSHSSVIIDKHTMFHGSLLLSDPSSLSLCLPHYVIFYCRIQLCCVLSKPQKGQLVLSSLLL